MGEVIVYPFTIEYRSVANNCIQFGTEGIFKMLMQQGFKDTVARVIIKQALARFGVRSGTVLE